jgi:hypothetical protein
MSSDLKNTVYDGMYTLFQYKTTYHLDGDAFSPELAANIRETTGLRKSDWLGDWWVHIDDNPELTWEELIKLALNILHNDATRLFVSNLHLKALPRYTLNPVGDLYSDYIRGAKRINACRGEYQEWCQISRTMTSPRNTGNKFRLSGKDESCCVEGTWFDWCCFACNVLASRNTELMCPELYEAALDNDNY